MSRVRNLFANEWLIMKNIIWRSQAEPQGIFLLIINITWHLARFLMLLDKCIETSTSWLKVEFNKMQLWKNLSKHHLSVHCANQLSKCVIKKFNQILHINRFDIPCSRKNQFGPVGYCPWGSFTCKTSLKLHETMTQKQCKFHVLTKSCIRGCTHSNSSQSILHGLFWAGNQLRIRCHLVRAPAICDMFKNCV